VRMNGIIDAPVQRCWDFLKVDRWDESMPKMDPFYEGVTVVGEYSHPESGVDMILCRKRTKRILAFGKRDLVFLSVVDHPLEDGTWVSGSVSVVTPHVPRHPGYTRAFQDSIAFYQPLDNNTRTNLTIVCRIDLNDSGRDGSGGWIPMWLYVKTIGVTAVESVLRMRHAIVGQVPQDEMQQQQQEHEQPGRQ
jgi:START domain